MNKANEILGAAVKRLGGRESALAWVRAAWPQLVGPPVAAHARPVRLGEGVLHISVAGKEWGAQLAAMEQEFSRRINSGWGGKLVERLEFVDERPAQRLRREADNSHTPFIRRGTTHPTRRSDSNGKRK